MTGGGGDLRTARSGPCALPRRQSVAHSGRVINARTEVGQAMATSPDVDGHDDSVLGSATADGPPPEASEPTTRPPLRRSTDDRVIAGVAGGLGRYLDVDPVVIRIALVVFALSGGAGLLLYLIAWVAIPEAGPGELPADVARRGRPDGVVILGAVLVVAGGLLFAERVAPWLSAFVGPMVLIGLGAALLLGGRR